MTELTALDDAGAAAALRAAGAAARGFLDLDPVTQNDALLARTLAGVEGRVFRAGDALVGAAPNPRQPRQALVACTSDEPAAVRALVGFLVTYRRTTSGLALVPDGAPAVAAFRGAGFTELGVLRDHGYGSGAYHDVRVLFGAGFGKAVAAWRP
ncbi:hypothetical protein RM844_13810 [Streptomyces sp. DSM 44915]|uniref:N-acetyltransferase n=1 Tax=Streptomyces chisholmiae TaxID=3075540 RepID=A0ABU2JQU6_9ACTN|nr:hypothetical protein [Streptomyces sp. DSM 44915]MDT0267362.1 hypothetical protein [Streptomyces sp. DSM 44915]